jgi:pimeloyl-ACP methyl ester carboxylesterase
LIRAGHEPASGLWFETVGPGAGEPWLLIHGGGSTGAVWRATPDGRPGWADLLAAHGKRAIVTDWPGSGRSGGHDPLELRYRDLTEGYVTLLRDVIAEPVTVMCHSMGGAVAWALVERCRELVHGVVSVAASYPGNLAARSEVISDDGRSVVARFGASGVDFGIDRERLYHYDDGYVLNQGIAGSTRFPRERIDAFRAGLVGIAPLVLLERLGVEPGLPVVEATDAFEGLPVWLVFGEHDPAHTPEIEARTAELLRSWGARVQEVALTERGITGNGHFLHQEANSDEILELMVHLVERS